MKFTWKICLLILISISFFSCDKKYIKFEDYLINNILKDKTLLENDIYPIGYLEYKARLIYSDSGTHLSIYDDINKENKIFDLKYWTIIEPMEIVNMNESILVKIKTKNNRIGWINARYIELY
ncbi:MAG: hypothetical protein LBI28_02710 [Treponema sp.]|jgi:hypothetical protein|nr:hypothetical protein [Treponema sp.]